MRMYFYTRNTAVLVCLVFIFVISVYGQTKTISRNAGSDCTSKETCTECIRTPKCIWCSEKPRSDELVRPATRIRCVDESTVTETKTGGSWCPETMIVKPDPGVKNRTVEEFSSTKDKQVQIMPRYVKMVLRPGQEEKITIRYKQANNYPVDLYFLMDLSASMEDHKNNLANLGRKLEEAMTSLTTDFHLGFGSFVDKVILPMTNSQPGWLSKNCKLKEMGKLCAEPYGYKNQMKLTEKVDLFKANVEAAPISGNLDAPEGGLDAMMQAMVCGNEIGWRTKARHIIVYSSDASYHIAGDGRLAGLIEPNDEKCHLNGTGFYTEAETLDYPSISQINKQALKNNINIIFAIVDKREITPHYEALVERINGSSLAFLDKKSDTVVKLVRQQYEKLTSTLTMDDNATEPLEVKYFTRCLNAAGAPLQQKECRDVHVGNVIEFDVTIKAVDCPTRREDWNQTIEIKPQGVNERVIIDIQLICDCPCSTWRDGSDYEKHSELCSRTGDLICGVCACDPGFDGTKCDCQGDNTGHQDSLSDKPCRDDNGIICSGRGSCKCSKCRCDRRPNDEEEFSGKFCECDNFSCKRVDRLLCGGPSKGECECGKCVCKPGLGGETCDCPISNSTCMPPGENTIMCNGFGKCECGKCQCATEREGQFCQECPTCRTRRCDELKNCVECQAHETGPEYVEGQKCPNCQNFDAVLVDDIDESPNAIRKEGTQICAVPDSSGCTFVFSYIAGGRGDTDIPDVEAEKAKKCPEPASSAYGVAGGAIALTLFLGLLGLIIWKIVTMYHDHHEWVKFKKECVAANWERGENPLFKEPTTSFKNPTFEGVKE